MSLLLDGQAHTSSIDLRSLLADKQELVIGRHESCCLRLDHITVSRKHATLSLSSSSSEWSFTCKGSTHHSFINGIEVGKNSRTILTEGDVLTFGKSPQKYIFSTSSIPSGSTETSNATSMPTTTIGTETARDAGGLGNTREDRLREIALVTASLKAPPSLSFANSMANLDSVDSHSNGGNDNDIDMDTANLAHNYQVPITSSISLKGHSKTVTAIHTDPSGARVLTGATDGTVNIYDFGGMDSRHNPFQSFCPEEGMTVNCLRYNCQGDRFLISTSNSQPLLYDRNGTKLLTFIRGDMYIRDLSVTKGHIMSVNDICWHPHDKHQVLTASSDGSIRLWNVADELYLNQLKCTRVYKLRNQTSADRIHVCSVAYSKDGRFVIGGTSEGVLQLFSVDTPSRPKSVINTNTSSPIHHILMTANTNSPKGLIVCKMGNGVVNVYDFGSMLLGKSEAQALVCSWKGLINVSSHDSICTNEDDSILCLTTTTTRDSHGNDGKKEKEGGSEQASHLVFIRLKDALEFVKKKTKDTPTQDLQQFVLHMALPSTTIPHCTWWSPKTNQVFITTQSGDIHVYFDQELSTKGALLSAHRVPSKLKVESFSQSIGKIYNPHALPMYKDDDTGNGGGHKGRKRGKDGEYEDDGNTRKKVSATQRPSQPKIKSGSSTAAYTAYVAQTIDRTRDMRSEDPREALLRVEEAMRKEGSSNTFTKAYNATQPNRLLADKTLDEEKEELRNKNRDQHL